MQEPSPEAERLLAALDMQDFGIGLCRMRVGRENPHATDAEIDTLVRAWLLAPEQGRILPRPPERRTDARNS